MWGFIRLVLIAGDTALTGFILFIGGGYFLKAFVGGHYHYQPEDLLFLPILVLGVLNILYLARIPRDPGQGLLSLWFQRKRLEEQRRIRDLEKQVGQN